VNGFSEAEWSRLGRAALAIALASGPGLAGCGSERGAPGPFRDVSAAAGLDFVHFNGMSGELYFSEIVGSGGALVDYDGDGDLDLFLVQGGMQGAGKRVADAVYPPRHEPPFADRLYRNDFGSGGAESDGIRLVDVTSSLPERRDGYGMGVAAGDVDNDGDVDLYVTTLGPNQLLRNRGDGRFEDVTAPGVDDPRWSTSAAFADLDRDDRLDLFVVNYVDYRPDLGKECHAPDGSPDYCGPQSYPAETARLLHNVGDGRFADLTLEAGIHTATGSGLGVAAADFDDDGWTDVYVANDQMANHLWMNRGNGTFVEEGLERGAALAMDGTAQASMGLLAEDLDADGDTDLFMTHLDGQTNTIYVNDGAGMFLDSSTLTGLGPPSVGFTGFGTSALDVDLDGDLDLVVLNGAVKRLPRLVEAGDPYPLRQPDQLFRNLGDQRFAEAIPTPSALGEPDVGRGTAAGDVDNDGVVDLLLTNNSGPAQLLLTEAGDGHWLGLRLRVAGGADGAPGARAELALAERTAVRWARSDGSYLSASDHRVLFGAGGEAAARRLDVAWPGGRRTRWLEPPLDRYLVLVGDARN
jgi:hypothetical protein